MSDKKPETNAWFLQCIKDGIVGADEESWARDRLASWMGQWESYNGLEDVAWIVMKAVREALEKAADVANEGSCGRGGCAHDGCREARAIRDDIRALGAGPPK